MQEVYRGEGTLMELKPCPFCGGRCAYGFNLTTKQEIYDERRAENETDEA